MTRLGMFATLWFCFMIFSFFKGLNTDVPVIVVNIFLVGIFIRDDIIKALKN